MDIGKALGIALRLVEDLESGCTRIEIAGSLRRGKPEVKDIEIAAIPRVTIETIEDMFGDSCGTVEVFHFEEHLGNLLDLELGWEWELDPVQRRNGPRYKRLRHKIAGICCDLFLTTERGWGGCLAIRTGPWDFSRALVTLARRQWKHVADGYLVHHHPKPKGGCPKGSSCPLIVPTPEEADFFAALDLPWIEPCDRTASWVWEKAKERVFR